MNDATYSKRTRFRGPNCHSELSRLPFGDAQLLRQVLRFARAINDLQAMRTRRRNREWEREVERLQLAVEEAEAEEAVQFAAQLQELDPAQRMSRRRNRPRWMRYLKVSSPKGAEVAFGPTRDEFESVVSGLRNRKRAQIGRASCRERVF